MKMMCQKTLGHFALSIYVLSLFGRTEATSNGETVSRSIFCSPDRSADWQDETFYRKLQQKHGFSAILQARVEQWFETFLNQTPANAWTQPEDEFIILVEQCLQHSYDVLGIGYLNRDHLLDEICRDQWLVNDGGDGDDDDDDDDVAILCAVQFMLESTDRLERMITEVFQMISYNVHDDHDDKCIRELCCDLVEQIHLKRSCPDLRKFCEKFIHEKFPWTYQNKYLQILHRSGVKGLLIYADACCHSPDHPLAGLLWLELTNYLDECSNGRPPSSPDCSRPVGNHERNIIEQTMLYLFTTIEHILFKHYC